MRTHDPDFDLPADAGKPGCGGSSDAALSSHFWGVVALFTWWLPILGQLAAATGLVRGFQGWRGKDRLSARIGVGLSILALVLAVCFTLWIRGVLELAAQSPGQHY